MFIVEYNYIYCIDRIISNKFLYFEIVIFIKFTKFDIEKYY